LVGRRFAAGCFRGEEPVGVVDVFGDDAIGFSRNEAIFGVVGEGFTPISNNA
jgi:hypothetical protein